jgi:hypothetical protein
MQNILYHFRRTGSGGRKLDFKREMLRVLGIVFIICQRDFIDVYLVGIAYQLCK